MSAAVERHIQQNIDTRRRKSAVDRHVRAIHKLTADNTKRARDRADFYRVLGRSGVERVVDNRWRVLDWIAYAAIAIGMGLLIWLGVRAF